MNGTRVHEQMKATEQHCQYDVFILVIIFNMSRREFVPVVSHQLESLLNAHDIKSLT